MLTPGPVAPLRNSCDLTCVVRPLRRTRDEPMRWIIAVIAVFGFLAWDISANNGHYVHQISAMADDLARQLGL